MLNKKRLKNLLLIKQKKLVNQKLEITTLDNEFKKNFDNRTKLKSILQNTKTIQQMKNWAPWATIIYVYYDCLPF